MKKFFYTVMLLGAFALSSCNDDEITVPNFIIEAEGFVSDTEILVSQDETIKLKVAVDNASDYQVTWLINDEVVSTEPTFNFVAQNLGMNVITVSVTTPDGGQV